MFLSTEHRFSLLSYKGKNLVVMIVLKNTLKAFNHFKNNQKVYEVMFFDMEKYVYSGSVLNTLYIEIKQKC